MSIPSSTQVRILFLAISPKDKEQLNLAGEYDIISQVLKKSPHAINFHLQQRERISRDELIEALIRSQPHILHFSGHGIDSQLIMRDEDGLSWALDKQILHDVLRVAGGMVKLIVFNACYLDSVAEKLSEIVDCVIGIPTSFDDQSAIKFAEGFYRGIFEGLNIGQAHEEALAQIKLSGLVGSNVPCIRSRHQLDMRIVQPLDWLNNPSFEIDKLNQSARINIPITRPGLRKALDQHLNSMEELNAFIIDYFPKVLKRRSSSMNRIELCNLLFETEESINIANALENVLKADASNTSHQPLKKESGRKNRRWKQFFRRMAFFVGIWEMLKYLFQGLGNIASTLWTALVKLMWNSPTAAGLTLAGVGATTIALTTVGVLDVKRPWPSWPSSPDLKGPEAPVDLGGRAPHDLSVDFSISPPKDLAISDLRNSTDLGCAETENVAAHSLIQGMVFIPGCPFVMGTDGSAMESPAHIVNVAGFYLDKTEVTVAAYSKCVAAGVCEEQTTISEAQESSWPGPEITQEILCNGNHTRFSKPDSKLPMNCVDFVQASKYCRWRGKRLPTEEEWEYAARGHEGRLFPWGNGPPTRRKACLRDEGRIGTCEVATHDREASGVWDLGGNVGEWIDAWLCDNGYNVTCPKIRRVVRGAAYHLPLSSAFVSALRFGAKPKIRVPSIGFRCAKSP